MDTTVTDSKAKSSKSSRKTRRYACEFTAQSAAPRSLVAGVGALGSAAMGAGAWALAFGESFVAPLAGHAAKGSIVRVEAIPSYILATGAVLTAIAVWLGTSSEPSVVVGSGGIDIPQGNAEKLAWHNIQRITYDESKHQLVVEGSSDSGAPVQIRIARRAQPQAVACVLHEAQSRIPAAIDIDDHVRALLPSRQPNAGIMRTIEPLQVVGKRDALTGEIISYEPDALVCARCERVYHRSRALASGAPLACACGGVVEARSSSPDANASAPTDTMDALVVESPSA